MIEADAGWGKVHAAWGSRATRGEATVQQKNRHHADLAGLLGMPPTASPSADSSISSFQLSFVGKCASNLPRRSPTRAARYAPASAFIHSYRRKQFDFQVYIVPRSDHCRVLHSNVGPKTS